ncbi:MAG: sensor histidine kinase [Myxococcota bacterium]
MHSNRTRLADHLRSRRSEIVATWMRLCEADPVLDVVSRLTRSEFRDGIPSAIDDFCEVLTRGRVDALSDDIRSDAGRHGHHRWTQGFDLAQVIRDWGRLNQTLVRVLEAYFEGDARTASASRTEAFDLLAGFITEATTGSIRRYDELRRAEAASVAEDVARITERFHALTEARGQLLRESAHDIRGGLSVIAMASDLLKASAEDATEPNDSFTIVLDRLDRGIATVRDLLNGLLDLSRLESGAEEVEILSVDIAAVLRELAQEYKVAAADRGLAFHAAGPPEMYVVTDPRKIRRIAQNLVLNALQQTSSGEVRLSWEVEARRWKLYVSDTGPGIQNVVGSPMARALDDPEAHPTTPGAVGAAGYGGEGIGLTIVKRLCSLLRGGVSLESEFGRGTTFTVEFPLDYDDD